MSGTKQSWEWNEDRWGYDGVHTHEGKLVWFTHKHNPHGGGGACEQSFHDFLENGPSQSPPPHVLKELSAAVKQLVKQR